MSDELTGAMRLRFGAEVQLTCITHYGSNCVYRDGPGLASIIVYLRKSLMITLLITN